MYYGKSNFGRTYTINGSSVLCTQGPRGVSLLLTDMMTQADGVVKKTFGIVAFKDI